VVQLGGTRAVPRSTVLLWHSSFM